MADSAIRVLLQAITGPYEAAMARSAAKTQAFAAQAQGATAKSRGLQPALGGLSTKLLAGGGLVLGLKAGVDKLLSYEDALVGVGKTTGLAGAELQALGQNLTALAGKVEGSAEDMLGIAQTAAQLGVAVPDIEAFTETIAGIATATDLTADAAAVGFARFANIMGEPISEVEKLGSVTVRLGNNMATTEPEILSMAQRVASAGRAAGMSSDEVLALAGAASSLGLEAEAGGTALSQTLIRIGEAAIVGGDELDVFAKIAGSSAEEFARKWEQDPVEALQDFIGGLDRFAEKGGNTVEVLDALGLDGMRTSDTLRRLAGGADLVATSFSLASEEAGSVTALADEVETATDRASVKIDNMKDSFDNLLRALAGGEEGTSGVGQTAEELGKLADAAADAWTWLVNLDGGGVRRTTESLNAQFHPAIRDTTARLDGFSDAVEEAVSWGSTMATDADRVWSNAAADYAAAQDGAADSLFDVSDAAAEAYVQQAELADQMRAATDPVFAFSRAADDVARAEAAAADAIEEHGSASDEAAAAVIELFEAELQLTDAALKVGGSAEAAEGELRTMAASGRLAADEAHIARRAINELGDAARSISGTYRVNIATSASTSAGADRVLRQLSGGSATLQRRAGGGPVEDGTPYLVGEVGPEMFVPEGSGRIVPAGQTRSMMGDGYRPVTGGGSTGGSVVVNATINTRSADPSEVVRALGKAARRSGVDLSALVRA